MDYIIVINRIRLVFFLLACFRIQAQDNSSQFFLKSLPLNTFSNASYQPGYEGFILGLPLISGFSVNSVSGLSFNSFIKFEKGNGAFIDFNSLYQGMKDDNMTRLSASVPLLFAGWKKGKKFYSFSLLQKGTAAFSSSPGIVKFINEGTAPYWGKNEVLGAGSFYTLYFRELGMGLSQRIGEKILIGGRGKILSGKTLFNARGIKFSVKTNETEKYLGLLPEGNFSFSAPVRVTYIDSLNYTTFISDVDAGDYFFSLNNTGFSADFGITWQPDSKLKLSFSLIDAGLIGFKKKTYSFDFIKSIRYPKATLFQSNDPSSKATWYKSAENAISAFGDSVSYIIRPRIGEGKIFEVIPLKLLTGIEYDLTSKISIGILNRYFFLNGFSSNSLSSMVMVSPLKNFEAAVSYTYDSKASKSLGLAVHYGPGNFNLYFITDNIQGVLQPAGTKTLNLCFGLLLKFKT